MLMIPLFQLLMELELYKFIITLEIIISVKKNNRDIQTNYNMELASICDWLKTI